jgi:lactate dehydrogenase-like 2-hydroxyacid dehydrogenase
MHSRQVYVTRKIPQPGLDLLVKHGAEVRIGCTDEDALVSSEQLLAGVRNCDVLLPLLTESVDAAVLAANPALRGVANYAVGFNNIDVGAATALGIPVSNTPGVLSDTTADLAWALLMACARQIVPAHQYMVAGRYKTWGPNLFLGADISPGGSGVRKVLGLVGFGRIGQAMARRSVGFEMDVLAYDPHARQQIEAQSGVAWADLDELLARSDFVSLHVLLNEQTRHLIGPAQLARMKSSAILINTARGPVVDERALVDALRSSRIAGAGLDVYEDEPLMAPGLAELDNVVLLPHIASASTDTRARMATIAATNALAHLMGDRAPDCVNPEVYETSAYRARVAR